MSQTRQRPLAKGWPGWILPIGVASWLLVAQGAVLLPQESRLHTIFTMSPALFVLFPPLSLLLWVLVRRRTPAKPLSLALGCSLTLGPGLLAWNIPTQSRSGEEDAADIRVMTLNVHYDSRRLTAALKLAQECQLDLIFLQENKGEGELMGDWLAKELGGWHQVHVGETAILSRWPMSHPKARELPVENWRSILSVTVNAPIPFRAVNCHWTIDRFFEPGDALVRGAQAQAANLRATLEECRGWDIPVVLGGDFNNTPRNGLTRALSSEMTNCFEAAGWGTGWTFPSRFPMVRIDHLYTSPGCTPLRAWVGPPVGSDHRPLIAEVQLHPRPGRSGAR